MSLAAMTWAFSLNLKPATAKFVLLALADNADDEGRAFPSVSLLADKTSLDRKTVIHALDELERLSLLRDTGSRVGRTRQVKVYRLIGFRARVNDSENGSVGTKASGTPPENDTGNGYVETVPKTTGNSTVFPSNSTVFPSKESQKRYTESSSNPQEPSGTVGSVRAKRSPDTATRLPADFELTEQRRQVAVTERVDPSREFANFRDHWSAASGARARKHDWDAAWRIWCRKSADMSDRQPPRGRPAEVRAVADANELQALKARRAEIGLVGFRDPYPHESADAYRTAQRLALQDRAPTRTAPKPAKELLS